MNKRTLTVRLPEPLLNRLKERSDQDGISLTELVTRCIRAGLDAPPLPPGHGDGHLECSISHLQGQVSTLQSLIVELLKQKS